MDIMCIKQTPLLIVLLCLVLSCTAQNEVNVSNSTFSKVYSKQAYLDDIDELAKTLTETHPKPYEFISEKDFWRNVEEKKNSITDSTKFGEFIWHASSIIASIGCGHTGFGYFNQESRVLPLKLRFPVEAKFINSRLYVSDPLVNSSKISVGDEISYINGKSPSEIKSGIYKHISADGYNNGFRKALLNSYFTAMISYYFQFPESFEIVVGNEKKPVKLSPLVEEYKYKPNVHTNNKCKKKLCLEILNEDTAKLTVRSFGYYGKRFEIFQTFIDKSFAEVKSKKIKNLIIDLKRNGGGSDTAGSYLLQHIADQPFTYFAKNSTGSFERKQETNPSKNGFRGKTYILMDGFGTSTTGHFLSLVKYHGFATLVGEEAGATYTVNDNSRSCRLTNTKISYRVARNTFFTTAKNLPKNRGVLPDHNVSQSIGDYVNGTDSSLDYTMNLISKSKSSDQIVSN